MRARRLDPPGNVRWEITVEPEGNGDVVIALPVTTDCTATGAICTGDGRKLSNSLELTVRGPSPVNTPATGAPTIGGMPQVGQTLTADTSGISDADGLTSASFEYQWVSGDRTTDTDIPGATSTSYLVGADDVGKTLKVRVSFSDDEGNAESLTSAPTAEVSATVPGAPSSVEVRTGGTGRLTVSWEAPASDGGSDITGYTVEWKESSDSWDAASDVSSTTTTATSYTISGLSPGTEYAVRVAATNAGGAGPASSEVTATAIAQTSQQQVATPNTAATGAPTISGTLQVGRTLTVDPSTISDVDGLTNAIFSYQWIRSDTTTDADIQGATFSTYELASEDVGRTIKMRVSFTDDAGNEESLTSTSTATVAAALTAVIRDAPTPSPSSCASARSRTRPSATGRSGTMPSPLLAEGLCRPGVWPGPATCAGKSLSDRTGTGMCSSPCQ